jgi:hypothetical protein
LSSLTGIRLPGLPFAAAGLQLVAARTPFDHGLVLVSHVVVAAWLVVNAISQVGWRRVGVGLALAGWLLNLAVMLPNGGMPVSDDAVAALAGRGHAIEVSEGHRSKHVPMTDDTVLAALGDVHPLPIVGIVYSAGDVLLAAGLLVILAAAWTPASLTSQRSRPDDTSSTEVPGSMGDRYSSAAAPSVSGSSSTIAQ